MAETETIAPHGGKLVNLLLTAAEAGATEEEAANLPKVEVGRRELSDLEMLAVGALSPLTGFLNEADYHSVLDELIRAKPPAAKGRYLRGVATSSSMGPGVRIDPSFTKIEDSQKTGS